ncbi:MAG: methylamine dehydrogenase light chain [Phenylobacterium sp.]
MSKIDALSERLTRNLAGRSSRRSLLSKLGATLVGASLLPVLPVARAEAQPRRATTPAQLSDFARTAQTKDDVKCDYWRYCAIDGVLCTGCGGGVHSCPPGTQASPTSWVGTCMNPDDGRSYLIAYRDCCGRSVCKSEAHCDGTEREMPVYRPQGDNEIIWCFGLSTMAYHCSTAALVGAV